MKRHPGFRMSYTTWGFRALLPSLAVRVCLDERAQLLAGLAEVGMLIHQRPQDNPAKGPCERLQVWLGDAGND
jgi:hypothetical protein